MRTRCSSSTSSAPSGLDRVDRESGRLEPGTRARRLRRALSRRGASRCSAKRRSRISDRSIPTIRRRASDDVLLVSDSVRVHHEGPGRRRRIWSSSRRAAGVALIRSRLKTNEFYTRIKPWLEEEFAPTTNLHGSLADVFGVGLLFVGQSGIGKSECVLDLVERGHRLVADDLVIARRRGTRRPDRARARAAAAPHGDSRRRARRHSVDLRHSRRAPAEAHRGRRAARGVESRRAGRPHRARHRDDDDSRRRAAEGPRAAQSRARTSRSSPKSSR